MANYIASDTDFISVANAIRTKGSTSASLSFPGGFVDAIEAFPEATTLDNLSVTSNGTYTPSSGHAFGQVSVSVAGLENSIIERTISGSYKNNTVNNIGNYAFFTCGSIINVNFPECTIIGQFAFNTCGNLVEAIFPKCTSIGFSAFGGCHNLSQISAPMCLSIDTYAFANCTVLSNVYFSVCERIGTNVFSWCFNLQTAVFPKCTEIASSAFFSCTKLNLVSFPSCTTLYRNAFYQCSVLSTVSFPECTTFSGSYIFASCRKLLSVYLLGNSVPELGYSNVFSNTPIAGSTASTGGVYGSIFVRASLLTAFQSATNWAYFSSRMVGLTDEEIAALEE